MNEDGTPAAMTFLLHGPEKSCKCRLCKSGRVWTAATRLEMLPDTSIRIYGDTAVALFQASF